MQSIFSRFDGRIGYELRVNEVLGAETPAPINRAFTLSFNNRNSKDEFFTDIEYLKVKSEYIESLVSHTILRADYDFEG
jgi:hypothetical protein